jgi:hypothetical protein
MVATYVGPYWPERAPPTKPCALQALDSPLTGSLSIHKLLIPKSLEDCHPLRILCSRHRNYPWCTPYTTATSRSSRYLQESGQGQGKSPELLSSPPPTQDSPLPPRINHVPHGGASWLNSIHQPHHPNIHHNHITRNICNYDGVNASKQTGIYKSASVELGNQGEAVSIKANKAQAIACIIF